MPAAGKKCRRADSMDLRSSRAGNDRGPCSRESRRTTVRIVVNDPGLARHYCISDREWVQAGGRGARVGMHDLMQLSIPSEEVQQEKPKWDTWIALEDDCLDYLFGRFNRRLVRHRHRERHPVPQIPAPSDRQPGPRVEPVSSRNLRMQ